MGMQLSTTGRNAELNSLVTALGGSATMKFYSGSRSLSPSSGLLATVTFGATAVTDSNGGAAGGVSGGVLTFGGVTQTSSGFSAGTPTFVLLSTSAASAVAAIDIGTGAGNLTFTGTIATGQNITVSGLTLTAGNP